MRSSSRRQQMILWALRTACRWRVLQHLSAWFGVAPCAISRLRRSFRMVPPTPRDTASRAEYWTCQPAWRRCPARVVCCAALRTSFRSCSVSYRGSTYPTSTMQYTSSVCLCASHCKHTYLFATTARFTCTPPLASGHHYPHRKSLIGLSPVPPPISRTC